jgi:hypothetical protein
MGLVIMTHMLSTRKLLASIVSQAGAMTDTENKGQPNCRSPGNTPVRMRKIQPRGY